MADDRMIITIKEDEAGEVRIAEEVVAIIAALAATEVEGVATLEGNITNDVVAKIGIKKLSKGVHITVDEENNADIEMAVVIRYGYSMPKVFAEVQEKVKTAVENMTGLGVKSVNVRIASVDIE